MCVSRAARNLKISVRRGLECRNFDPPHCIRGHPTNRPHLAHILTAQTDTATTLSRSARGVSSAPEPDNARGDETGSSGECFSVERSNYLFTSESVSEG